MTDRIPYTEMRRILGLPEPTLAMWMQSISWALRNFASGLKFDPAAITAFGKSLDPEPQAPPMWANNPGRTRRTTFKPTRRVK